MLVQLVRFAIFLLGQLLQYHEWSILICCTRVLWHSFKPTIKHICFLWNVFWYVFPKAVSFLFFTPLFSLKEYFNEGSDHNFKISYRIRSITKQLLSSWDIYFNWARVLYLKTIWRPISTGVWSFQINNWNKYAAFKGLQKICATSRL